MQCKEEGREVTETTPTLESLYRQAQAEHPFIEGIEAHEVLKRRRRTFLELKEAHGYGRVKA